MNSLIVHLDGNIKIYYRDDVIRDYGLHSYYTAYPLMISGYYWVSKLVIL